MRAANIFTSSVSLTESINKSSSSMFYWYLNYLELCHQNELVQKISIHPVADMFLVNEWYWKFTEYFGIFTGKSKPGDEVFTGNPGWNLS